MAYFLPRARHLETVCRLSVALLVIGCSSDTSGSDPGGSGANGSGSTSGTAGNGPGSGPGGGGSGAAGGAGAASSSSGSGAAGGASSAGGGGAGGGPPCPNEPPIDLVPPGLLSETALYTDIAAGTVAPYVRQFQPQYPLWSDAADKQRYAYLPSCEQVDTTDMDHWKFPVGTRFWKEFTVNGVRVETRLLHRWGPGKSNWLFAAYEWNDSQTEAVHVPNGVMNSHGTEHDIPTSIQCTTCHVKLDERVLGYSAFQLSHGGSGDTIATLSAEGKLTVPAPLGFTVPGNAVDQAALGYLHANCGNCHNQGGANVNLYMRLLVSNTTVQETDAYTSGVNVVTANWPCGGCVRIAPGDAAASAIVMRMSVRGNTDQMPPIGTEVVDDTGVQVVSDWVNSLPP